MDKELKRLQQVQLNMLKLFDHICRDNNLRYSLYAGTLLGAVRHQGFIPWDDDLDVCMPREDYDKFLSLWPQIEHDGYTLQNKENTPAFTQSFSKIRKDHTAFVQEEWEKGRYHTGIFIDVFPMDRIPNGKLARYLFYWRSMRYQLYTREFVPKENGKLMKLGSKVLLWMTTKKSRSSAREHLIGKLTANNNNNSFLVVSTETVRSMRVMFDSSLWDELVELPFEDGVFSCFSQWDKYLTTDFGEYMQFPPKEQQTWTHHPICLDFDKNYEDLEGV